MSNKNSAEGTVKLAESAIQLFNKQTNLLDPSKAKLAAAVLRDLYADNLTLKKENTELKTKVAEFNKYEECLALAQEMAGLGYVEDNFNAIKEKAAELRVKNLQAVREGMQLAHDKFAAVSDSVSDRVNEQSDPLSAAILNP